MERSHTQDEEPEPLLVLKMCPYCATFRTTTKTVVVAALRVQYNLLLSNTPCSTGSAHQKDIQQILDMHLYPNRVPNPSVCNACSWEATGRVCARCADPDMAMAASVLKKLVLDKEEESVP